MTEASSERFDRISKNYVNSEVHKSSPTIARLHELLANAAVKSVADVACGAGHLGLSFARHDGRLAFVDPSESMLAAATAQARDLGVSAEAYRAFAEELPLPGGGFDLTCSRLAPHHFRDVARAVAEMARITRAGGFVAVIDLQGADAPEADALNHHLELLHDPTHRRSYPTDEWLRVFEQSALRIQAFEPNHSERPGGVTVSRWCEIASSGAAAEAEINARLLGASPSVLKCLGIERRGDEFLMPIRTVLLLAKKA